jgi:hypothetical protein
MTPEDREAFVRWQGISIQHRGQTINLLIALSTGLLAYGVNLAISGHGPTGCFARISFRTAIISLLVSIGSGVVATFSRTEDFLNTTETARVRSSEPAYAHELRKTSTTFGSITMACFRAQEATFFLAATTFVVSMWISYADKF